MERVSTIGLDLAKQAFQVHGMNKDGDKFSATSWRVRNCQVS